LCCFHFAFTFRSPRKAIEMSSSLISCLCIPPIQLAMHYFPFPFFLNDCPKTAFVFYAFLFCYCFNLTCLIQKNFSAVLLVEFMFDLRLSLIITAFTNSPSLHFAFSYSAVLSLLYMTLMVPCIMIRFLQK